MQVYNRPKNPKHQSKFIPCKAAAAMLGVHPTTLRRWATEGAISYTRGEGACPQRRYDVGSYGLELVPGKSPRPGVFLGGGQPKSTPPPNAYKKGESGRDRITPATEAKRKQSQQPKTALVQQLLNSDHAVGRTQPQDLL